MVYPVVCDRWVMKKEYRKLQQFLLDNGYTFQSGRGGHWKVLRPNGSYLVTWPSSPSEYRGVHNMVRDLRRAGVEVNL